MSPRHRGSTRAEGNGTMSARRSWAGGNLVCIVYANLVQKATAVRAARKLRDRGQAARAVYSPLAAIDGCPCLPCAIRRLPPFSRGEFQSVRYVGAESAAKYVRKLLGTSAKNQPSALPKRTTNRKESARRMVARAIQRGSLVRATACELCGRHQDDPALIRVRGRHQQVIQADHRDYDRPLKVTWLCIPCHHTMTNAWHISWNLRQHAKFADHPAPPPWWCWVCRTYHQECPVMCPVDFT